MQESQIRDGVQEGLARVLSRRLSAPVRAGGALHLALAEAEGSTSFPTAGNAAAAAALSHPLLWDADPDLGTALFDFLLAMGPERALRHGAIPTRLQVEDADPRAFRILTPAHVFTGDLSRGLIAQAPRNGVGARPGATILHTGNLLAFDFGGRRHLLDVEDSITEFGLDRVDGGVVLHHTSRILGRRRFGRRDLPIGTLRYAFEIRAASPALRLTVTFAVEPSASLKRMRVTSALDGLGLPEGPAFPELLLLRDAGAPSSMERRQAAPVVGTAIRLHEGPAAAVVLVESGPPGTAQTLALRFPDGARLFSLTGTAQQAGRVHWLLARYAADRLGGGEVLEVREERLLLASDAAAAPEGLAQGWPALDRLRGLDPTACPEPGVVLEAVATHLLFAEAGCYRRGPDEPRRAALHAFLDRHLAAWRAALAPDGGAPDPMRAWCRDLAFALMAQEALWRMTGGEEHRAGIAEALDLLLSLQRVEQAAPGLEEGAFRDAWDDRARLEGHAAAMLALARLAEPGGDPRIGLALRRALAALRLTGVAAAGRVVDAPAVRSRGADGAGWAEDAGTGTPALALLLRALRALQAARATGALDLPEEEARRAAFLAETCARLLEARIRPVEDGGLEVTAGPHSGDTDLLSQALALRTLVPPDAAVRRLALPSPVAA